MTLRLKLLLGFGALALGWLAALDWAGALR